MARYQGERMGFADSLEEMYEHVNARDAPYYYSEELGFYMDEFYMEESAQVWFDTFIGGSGIDITDSDVLWDEISNGLYPFEEIDLYGFIYSEDGFSESRNEIDVRLYPLLSRPEAQWDIYSTYKAALEAKDDELAKYSEYTVIFTDEISGKTEKIEV